MFRERGRPRCRDRTITSISSRAQPALRGVTIFVRRRLVVARESAAYERGTIGSAVGDHHVRDVFLHAAFADMQNRSDLLVRPAIRDQFENTSLSFRQRAHRFRPTLWSTALGFGTVVWQAASQVEDGGRVLLRITDVRAAALPVDNDGEGLAAGEQRLRRGEWRDLGGRPKGT